MNNKEKLSQKSFSELEKIKDDYVNRYIGDFNKPWNYKAELKALKTLISQNR